MHERSLVKALLRQVGELAAEYPGSRIRSIQVCIGEFSGVEPELLASAYDDLVIETPFRGAALNLEQVPLEAGCDQCGSRFRIERFNFQCDKCGSPRLTIRVTASAWLAAKSSLPLRSQMRTSPVAEASPTRFSSQSTAAWAMGVFDFVSNLPVATILRSSN